MKAAASIFLIATFPLLTQAIPMVPLEGQKLTHSAHFFEGSTREDLAPEQAPFLVQVHLSAKTVAASYGRTDQAAIDYIEKYMDGKPTCSAFFVRNKKNKMFVGSSRHCFSFNAEKLFAEQGVIVRDFVTQSEGRPTRIVVSDRFADMFIFEVDFGANTEVVQKSRSSLIPAMYASNTPEYLNVFGFPADQERGGRPTLSRNCELFPFQYDREAKKFFPYALNKEGLQKMAEGSKKQGESFGGKDSRAEIVNNLLPLKHNCSIYGGNSGGPAVLARAPEYLVGIPQTYLPDTKPIARDYYGLLETPYWIFKNHKETLEREGIVYREGTPPKAPSGEL